MGTVSLTGSVASTNQNSNIAGLPPSICKNLTITKDGTAVSLKWQDPANTILDKQYLCTWAGTKIVRKAGSYPTSESDGTVIVDNTTMNQYSTTAYEDTLPDTDNDYYYAAFPYSTNGVYCYNTKNNFLDAIIYEFTINPDDSNPATRVAYPTGCQNENFDNAYMNFTSGSWIWGDWENKFFMPKPCMLKTAGTVDYYLYLLNYLYKEDGVTLSDITNTSYDGSAMLEWEQVWIKYAVDGTLKHIYISNVQVDEDYHCYTHKNANGDLVDNIYTQIYQPALISGKLKSLSGTTIYTNVSGVTMQTYAQANGSGWDFMTYSQWKMIQVLTTLITKSTNTETTIGCGRYSSANATTGEGNTDGYFFGTNSNGRIKMWGAENPIGNYWKSVNGCNYTSSGLMYKLSEDTTDGSTVVGYNSSSNGYKTAGTITGTSGGYISKTVLNSDGIFPSVVSGSSTTYECDGCWFAAGGFGRVGGNYNNGSLDGVFALNVNNALSNANANYGASISYTLTSIIKYKTHKK